MNTNKIITADCFEKLERLPKNNVHAVVTDPPYGLAFMGKSWDDFEPKEYQEWCEEWATKVKDVLKPGGHLVAFSGNRTYHRLTVGVEDAGFEVRDRIPAHGPSIGLGEYNWVYGSGFPKASDISKSIDKRKWNEWLKAHPRVKEHLNTLGVSERQELKAELKKRADAEREVVGTEDKSSANGRTMNTGLDRKDNDTLDGEYEITEPATDAAKKWAGWKTGLKPAHEPILVARKPFDGATVDCVLRNGTGALNIDGTRIESEDGFSYTLTDIPERTNRPGRDTREEPCGNAMARHDDGDGEKVEPEGRYPSNVIFDSIEAERLDRENENTAAGNGNGGGKGGIWSESVDGKPVSPEYGDEGGISRYFYTSKASKAERTENGSIENTHPTVKPQDLMEWLVKLVTAENQIVLDPFAGTGTTCKAAKELNRQFIGIEKQAKWADVARVRCNLTPEDPSVVRDSENQKGLEAYDT